jgi:hypothetical protein
MDGATDGCNIPEFVGEEDVVRFCWIDGDGGKVCGSGDGNEDGANDMFDIGGVPLKDGAVVGIVTDGVTVLGCDVPELLRNGDNVCIFCSDGGEGEDEVEEDGDTVLFDVSDVLSTGETAVGVMDGASVGWDTPELFIKGDVVCFCDEEDGTDGDGAKVEFNIAAVGVEIPELFDDGDAV